MKSTITNVKPTPPTLSFADLVPGNLYNYKESSDSSGVVFCVEEIYTGRKNSKRIVELNGSDAGKYWRTDGDDSCQGITFTIFTDTLQLTND